MTNFIVRDDDPLYFERLYHHLRERLLLAPKVDTGHWQSIKNVPHTHTRELQYVHLEMAIAGSQEEWARFINPNLPWAEDHFQERVSGEPLNPGEQYKYWPWYAGGVENHKQPGQFSHSYMERIWPQFANRDQPTESDYPDPHQGIRYRYGDLDDLINLLWKEPHTRQAYLPIWFPEDLAAAAEHEQRVPCTLGYHFMLRDGRLNCFYPMRSVDFVRYLRDDLYMAGRLVHWILQRLKAKDDPHDEDDTITGLWPYVQPGKLVFMASSLHCFEGDVAKLNREAAEYVQTHYEVTK